MQITQATKIRLLLLYFGIQEFFAVVGLTLLAVVAGLALLKRYL